MSTITKARISGLSCAVCAAGIEKTLQAREGLAACRINFATGTIRYPAEREAEVQDVICEIEPDVRIERDSGKHSGQPGPWHWRESWRLVLSGMLFVLVLFGEQSWNEDGLQVVAWGLAFAGWLLAGWGVLRAAVRNLLHGRVFDENFLMTLATLGAFAIGHLPEALGVMLFYHVGELAQDSAVQSSRSSIQALAGGIAEESRVVTDSGTHIRPAQEIPPGVLLEVWPGERISHDGVLEGGPAWLDTSALTGESRPRMFDAGSDIQAGYLVVETRVRLRVTRMLADSAVSRIMHLVEEATQRKAQTERFMTRFAAVYTPVVVLAAVLLATIPPLVSAQAGFEDWFFRALVFLVISCPCALVVSIPLGYYAGIGAASRNGILVKGGIVLDALARVRSVVFDKTGTVTDGKYRVRRIIPGPGWTEDGVVQVAAAMEAHSNHPVARAVREAYSRAGLPSLPEMAEIREVRGRGLTGRSRDGKMCVFGSAEFVCEACGCAAPQGQAGLYLAIDGVVVGAIEIDDGLRPSSRDAVTELRTLGVQHVALFSGDSSLRASQVGTLLGMDAAIGGLLPKGKLKAMENLMQDRSMRTTVFVGDGINDAPVIKRADVGIAMGGLGSDAAIEAADAVLVEDDPLLVSRAVRIARATRRVVWNNILFALSFKVVFLLLGGLGLASLWEAVIADVGVALVALANSMRLVWGNRFSH